MTETYTTFKRMKPLLGTFVEIGMVSEQHNLDIQTIFTQTFATIEMLQNQMSFHDSDSALSKLNHAQGKWLELPPETIKVLKHAKQLYRQTDGLFNCTLGGYLVKRGKLPNHFDFSFKVNGSSEDIEIENGLVRLRAPFLVTLDGIAKGYAVDCAVETMQRQGVQSGWVNAGGDLRVFGEIEMPIYQRSNQGLSNLITLKQNALATSEVNQFNRYDQPSHIINNHGQWPDDCIISVRASKAWLADGLTKVLALLPDNQRKNIAERFDACYCTASEQPEIKHFA
ncbi:FAD:protein FMN transferase [Thiomicrorhabdus sp. ZW0627]|uniref:FAD:protein FMN transferase n=1 Tax=Thiomicrorhabdus sp. ZW0627 TaxID=3039774 RepID=UPI002437066C|nr:FAD:protein FMN transferase [Thiomicrorhabdus sp. ZW0627]MDG6773042.1 FAD:protein FMN transferase [Thiomicrorhabdus sp. ZW0627]